MISRAALARSVCLRCQLRLLDPSRAHSSFRARPIQTKFLLRRQYSEHQSVWDRLEESSRNLLNDTSPKEPTDTKDTRDDTLFEIGLNHAFYEEPQDAPHDAPDDAPDDAPVDDFAYLVELTPTPRKGRPLVKRRGSGRVLLQSEHLGVEMMGELAETIVMREARQTPLQKTEPLVYIPADGIDIAMQLEQEEKDFTDEDALANIDEIRPTDPIVSRAEFDSLLKILINGFTSAQLKAYYARANSISREEPQQQKGMEKEEEGKKDVEYSWVRKKWPWQPLRTIDIVGSPKEKHCIVLMTETWGLEIREMIEGKGGFMAEVEERFLALLARDEQRLTTIRQTYLDAGEYIKLSKTRVKILATKVKSATIMQKFDEAARDVVHEYVKAGWISNGAVSSTLLSNLGKITNTIITYDATEKQIGVSWFRNPDGEDDGQERLHNVVHRLLHTALCPRESTVTLKFNPNHTSGRLIPEVRGQEKLSWKDRFTQWFRWVKPINRFKHQEPRSALTVSKVLTRPLHQSPHWDHGKAWSRPYNPTTASFGLILHKNEGDFTPAAAARNINHIFSPAAPPLANLNNLTRAVASSEPLMTSLVLTFRPHPSLDKKATRSLPGLLELQFTVPSDLPEGTLAWDAYRKRLVAVLDQRFTDVARPSRPIDLRLAQPLLTEMSTSALEKSPFRGYIETAKLDLLTGRLSCPPEITLSDLPSVTGTSDSGSDVDVEIISKPVQFLFAGMEIRRTLDFAYEGHRLQYKSIQAGHHGGRRAELVLEATEVPPSSSSSSSSPSQEEQQAHAEKFLSLVQDLAEGKVVKWVGEPDAAAAAPPAAYFAPPAAAPASAETSAREVVKAEQEQKQVAEGSVVDDVDEPSPPATSSSPSAAEQQQDTEAETDVAGEDEGGAPKQNGSL